MARCAECDATIFWARTANGGRMPIDIQRVQNGNLEIDDHDTARVVRPDRFKVRHIAHHATCPVEQERRRQGAAAKRLERESAQRAQTSKQLGLFGGGQK